MCIAAVISCATLIDAGRGMFFMFPFSTLAVVGSEVSCPLNATCPSIFGRCLYNLQVHSAGLLCLYLFAVAVWFRIRSPIDGRLVKTTLKRCVMRCFSFLGILHLLAWRCTSAPRTLHIHSNVVHVSPWRCNLLGRTLLDPIRDLPLPLGLPFLSRFQRPLDRDLSL